jgi:diacylglycerol kinase (ATP)
MTSIKLIVNPMAGVGKTGRRWPELKTKFEATGLKFDYELTERPGHAVELAREAVRNGYELIVSVGGDGTINEIVNGIYGEGSGAMLGIICTGTGSDFIRTLNLPRDPVEACKRLLKPERMAVDLGVVEYLKNGQPQKRLFVNFAGVGIDAEITRATTASNKKLGGKPGYLSGLVNTLVTYHNEEAELIIDGVSSKKKLSEVLVSNGKYGGGSMYVAPRAELSDGLFDVMLIDAIGRFELLSAFPMIYKGTHEKHPKVTMLRGKEIEVRPAHPWPLQADGEVLGETPVKIEIIPKAINIAV